MNTQNIASLATLALVAVIAFKMLTGTGDLGYQLIPGISMAPASVTTFTQGGGVYATSSAVSASTLLTEAVDNENVIDMTLTNQDATLTFMASSSFPGIPNPGDTRTIFVRNATTTAGIDLTIAVGTGMTLKRAASSTVLLIGDTDGDNTAKLDFVRKSDTDINVYLSKYED